MHPRSAVRKAPRRVALICCSILLGVRSLWLQFADPRTFSMLVSPLSAPAPSYVPLACNGSRGDVWYPWSSDGDWEYSRKLPQSAGAAHCGWLYCRCHCGKRNLVCVERLGRFPVLGRARLATIVFEDAGTRKRTISAKRKVSQINKSDGFPKA